MTIIVQTSDPSSNRDYDWLQARVKSWLHRTDLDERIPEFIALGEQRINRLAKIREMEIETPLTMETGSRFIVLPGDFNAPVGVWLKGDGPRRALTQTLPEHLPVTTSSGAPNWFSIDSTNLAFERPADRAHQVTLRYRAKFALSDAIQTNVLLMEYPDLYLYASLLAAAPFIRDTATLAIWDGTFKEAVREINANARRSRTSAPLRTELAAFQRSSAYDFNRDM